MRLFYMRAASREVIFFMPRAIMEKKK